MKRLELSEEENRTLLDMGIYHPHARTRRRAQGVRMLGQGMTLQQVADEFKVHLNSVEHWRQCWLRVGLVGLYEGRHSGRPPTLSRQRQRDLGQLARDEGGSSGSLLRRWRERGRERLSRCTLRRYLRQMGLRYKRCRLSLKGQRNEAAFERAEGAMASLRAMARMGQCELLYFDEAGFGPNPPLQYGSMPVGQTRAARAGTHEQRVNVLGALRHDRSLVWHMHDKRTTREDVMAFLDELANQAHSVPRILVLDNAAIHKGEPMRERRQQWERQDLYLYYLPPYSPELNRIEILWKQAKYFWRSFRYLAGDNLRDEVRSIMENYGKAFTVNFA
ncbi:MAG: IS630 family transposase [Pseudomonadota bacterium]